MAEQQISRFDSRRLIDNREMRIFLSSTFLDMEQERKALIKTFQTLRIEAIRRNVTLSVLDLRWGVTDEEACTGKVLSVCLEEIEHSHPFFIGLLGNCYGSSPDISVLDINPELEERYPWIREDINNGLSYTEIEMQYGALRNNHDVDAVFFVKNTADVVADDNEKLTRLKQQIHGQDRFPNSEYTSMDDLCNRVEQSVLAILDKHFPEKESTRLEHERTVQKAYINNRHGHYRKPIADFRRLDDFLNGDEANLVITGRSGMGKSALIANWLREKETAEQSHNIIYHFVGNSFSGSDHRQILQHICDELYNLYGIERHEGLNEKLEDEAQRVLVEAGQKGKPVLIVIDGINQIADHNHSKLLNWLPQAPHFAKYLFSTLDGDETMETFKRREYTVHQIGTLDRASRREFIINYLRYVGKKLADGQIDRILDDPENENMLVLKTLLDELICFGARQQLDQRIDYYLSSSSIDDFFDRMLQRMEEDYEEVPRILSLIALSENGMTEDELRAITGLRPIDIHLFYCAFYNHFVTRDGLITFGHRYVTEAIWQRYGLEDPAKASPYRWQIIDHVSNSDSISRTRQISELAFQYYHTGDDEDLYKTILSFEAFRCFNASDEGDATLALYWRRLLESDPEKYQLQDYLNLPKDEISLNRLLLIAKFLFTYWGDGNVTQLYSEAALSMSVDSKDSNLIAVATSYNNIGAACRASGDYKQAIKYFQKALKTRKRIYGLKHLDTSASYNNLGLVYFDLGCYRKAMNYYKKALRIKEKLLGENHPITATSYNNLGMVYDSLGDYPKALKYYQKALKVRTMFLGLDNPDTTTTYNNIGCVYKNQGDYDKALEILGKTLDHKIKIFGPNHPSTSITYNNIGAVFICKGEYDKALDYYLKDLAICESVFGSNHLDTATSYNNIGGVYYKKGEYGKALKFYLKDLSICENILGTNHLTIAKSYNNIGLVLYGYGCYEKALKYYFKSLKVYKDIRSLDYLSIVKIYYNIGDVYDKMGYHETAVKYYLKAKDLLRKSEGKAIDSLRKRGKCKVLNVWKRLRKL